ncbi:RNA polymerase sigma factor [Gelidibacter japonicus]|uniref:RNA polymerase sigma factor n=1 Tax=Gelidibacter japonicus TaxID=1962232 RepID=UPI0013D5E498|nr:sigma-70 family RNA polymerase sigma factor [Gelidibacter japonicus]MCL8006877.1 sigma-70 family RNA polymerase sigma factor [Gelidibacter japonicus]
MERHKNRTLVLWTKLKDGDVRAMGDLYDIYVDELFAYGMQFSSDKSQVMDAIHDLFLNLYKYRKTIAVTDNVTYYLFRSLKNNILKIENKSRTFIPHKQEQELKLSEISIEDRICAEEFENDRAYKLAKAITKLSKRQRKALSLRFTQERSYEEVAAIMKVSVATSRTIIYRAIKTLRKQLYSLGLFIFSFFL